VSMVKAGFMKHGPALVSGTPALGRPIPETGIAPLRMSPIGVWGTIGAGSSLRGEWHLRL